VTRLHRTRLGKKREKGKLKVMGGARVRHKTRGAGTIIELMEDGRTRVAFDDGEEHRYKPASMKKLVATRDGLFSVTYLREVAGREVKREDLVLAPMAVHTKLSQQYLRRIVDGWTHQAAMAELNEICGLPVVWKGAKPFEGNLDPKKLKISWIVNTALLMTISGTLIFYLLSYLPGGGYCAFDPKPVQKADPMCNWEGKGGWSDEAWGKVFETFVLGTFVSPLLALFTPLFIRAGISLFHFLEHLRDQEKIRLHTLKTKASSSIEIFSGGQKSSASLDKALEAAQKRKAERENKAQEAKQVKVKTVGVVEKERRQRQYEATIESQTLFTASRAKIAANSAAARAAAAGRRVALLEAAGGVSAEQLAAARAATKGARAGAS
jgi:hypothetical protein